MKDWDSIELRARLWLIWILRHTSVTPDTPPSSSELSIQRPPLVVCTLASWWEDGELSLAKNMEGFIQNMSALNLSKLVKPTEPEKDKNDVSKKKTLI